MSQSQFIRTRLMREERTATIGVQLACRAISTHVVARNLWEDVDWDNDFEAAVNDLLNADEPVRDWRIYGDD